MRFFKLSIIMFVLCSISSSAFAQQRITSVGADVYEGVIRIKFDSQTVDGFSSIQMKSASTSTPNIFATGISSIDVTNNNPNVYTFSRVFPYSPKFEARHRKYGLHQWYEVRFDSKVEVEDMMDTYSSVAGIEVIKPVFKKIGLGYDAKAITLTGEELRKLQKIKTKSTSTDERYPFDDPLLEKQWHYENFGDIAGNEDADIDLFGAWKTETGNDSVIVAIVDGGVDFAHEDLADAMWVNEKERDGQAGVDDDENGYIDDVYGYNFYSEQGPIEPIMHGTHVAGTVGAVNNNGVGVCGVAGGGNEDGTTYPGVRLMSCQIFGESGNANGSELAYVYAADNGAVIAQSSWSYTEEGYSEEEVRVAIEYFYNEAGNFEGSKVKGGLHFFSSGNESSEGDYYPAAYENVIGINATGPFNTPASYTNYGEAYDISAPGGDFMEDGTDVGGILSTTLDDTYGYLSGTSMATPHVSGVAALIVANSTDEELTNEDVYAKLLGFVSPFTTEDVSGVYEGKMGVGHLNALNCLLENEGVSPEPVGDFRFAEITHSKVVMEWQVPVDSDDIKPTSYYVYLGYEEFETDDLSDVEQFTLVYDGEVGDTVTATLSGLESETNLWFAVQAADFWGNTSEFSEVLPCKTLSAPVFYMKDHKFMFHVDATKQLYADTIIDLVNKGEGLLEWTTDVANYSFVFPSLIDSSRWYTEAEMNDTTTVNGLMMKSSFIDDNTIVSSPVIPGTEVETDYLDKTIYTSALYNDELEIGPEAVIGDFKTDYRTIQATRFQVPLDYSFTLTHVEAWIYHTLGKLPIKMEVRTGKELQSSEVIYQRYYTPDTTGLQLACIPLERPFILDDGIYFWLLLSHPEKETMPIVTNYMDILYETSYMSTDGGYTWEDFVDVCGMSPQQMKIRAYSVGDDPSYTYIDPVSGEVKGNDSTQAHLYVNAENLRNGEHRSYINIYTNDYYYISTSINMNIWVTGQKGELTYERDQEVTDVYLGQSNEITIPVVNNGLGDLEMQGVDFPTDEWAVVIDTAYTLMPTQGTDLKVTYTPKTTGYKAQKLIIRTDAEDYTVFLNVGVSKPSNMSVEYGDTLRESLVRGNNGSVTFTITNTDSEVPLDFDVYSESYPDGEHAKSRIYNYDYERFNDASRWDPINEFAPAMNYYSLVGLPLSFRFAFYEEVMDKVSISDIGWAQFSSVSGMLYDLPNSEAPKGAMIPLGDSYTGGGMLNPAYTYYYGYGNRYVIQSDSLANFDGGGKSSFQTAIFKDGSFEYRYKVVDSLDYKNSIIGIQDFMADSSCVVKNSDDTTFIINDNDVIRFTPRESAPFLGYLSTDKGRLMPGESTTITVNINPDSSQLVTGSYHNKIRIDANTLEQNYYIPVVLDVVGKFDSLTVDTNIIAYGKVNTLTQYTDTLWVTNHSDNVTKMTGFSTSGNIEGLQIRGGLSDFAPRESKRLLIDFIPQVEDNIDEIVTLSTSTGDIKVRFTAKAVIIPTFEHNALDVYSFDLDEEAKTDSFTLYNTSKTTPLKYQIFSGGFVALNKVDTVSKPGIMSINSKSASLNSDDDEDDVAKELRDALPTSGLVDSAYSWEVSNGENAVNYFLDNLITIDEAVKMVLPKNGFVPVALKFDFLFYGETYDTVWVNENGYLTVIEPEVDADFFDGNALTKDDGIRGIIMPFLGDWTNVEGPTNGIFMLNEEDRMVIQWRNVYTLDSYSPGLVSFEVILFNDGRIKFVYENINDYLGLFDYCLESPSETNNVDLGREGWEINDFGVYADSSAITLAPACFGELEPGDSINVQISASPSYMLEGEFEQKIIIKTDALISTDSILVKATVAPKDESVASDTIDFGTHYYIDDTPVTGSFWVNNRGRDEIYIKYVISDNLSNVELQNENGYTISRYDNGRLEKQHCLIPGEMIFYNLSYTPDSTLLDNVTYGVHYNNIEVKLYDDEGTTFNIVTKLTLEERPDLTSQATDTTFVLNQNEEQEFSFEIKNEGADTLDYEIKGIYTGDKITYDDPIGAPGAEFDKISYANTDIPDGNYANLSGIGFIITTYLKPETDFDLTHVKVHSTLKYQLDYTVRLEVYEYKMDTLYDCISVDTMGTLLSTSEHRYQDDFGEKWRYMALPETKTLEAGKQYFINVIFPTTEGEDEVLSTRLCYDHEISKNFYFTSGSYYYKMYGFYSSYMNSSWIPMIDLISGASTDGFMTFSLDSGQLAPNETQEIDVEIDPSNTSSGDNVGIVSIDATNIVDHYEFDVTVDVNAKPNFIITPTNDTLVIQEKVPYVGSYLVEDPEGDKITCSIVDDDGLDVVLTSKEEAYAGLVQLSFNTGWEDEGIYDVVVEARDINDNVNFDTLTVEVYNINRTPYMSFDDAIVINMAHNEVFQKNMNEMFVDPDNDILSFEMGNGNPELYDMALLNDELLIAPIEAGVGIVIFAADDGYDDGYAGYYYYIYIIDDKSVAPTQDAILPTVPEDEVAIENMFTAPNPTSGNSGLYFNLEEDMKVSIELYDTQGRAIKTVANHMMSAGNRYVETSLHSLSAGVYFYKVTLGNEETKMIRIMKD